MRKLCVLGILGILGLIGILWIGDFLPKQNLEHPVHPPAQTVSVVLQESNPSAQSTLSPVVQTTPKTRSSKKIPANKTWEDLTHAYPGELDYTDKLGWIHSTPNLPSYLPDLPEGTLVIIGESSMDQPKDTLFKCKGWEDIMLRHSKLGWLSELRMLTILDRIVPKEPIDPDLPNYMVQWLQKGVRVLVISRRSSGPGFADGFRQYPDAVGRTLYVFKQMGYPLESFWKDVPKIILPFPKKNPKSPVFRGGMLFCGNVSPRRVLEKFLETIPWKPKRIVFIGMYGKVRYVSEQLVRLASRPKPNNRNIPCLTLFCLKDCTVEEHRNLTPTEQIRAEFQVEHYKDTGEWLSDELADETMKCVTQRSQ